MDHCVVNAKRRSRRFYSSKNQSLTTRSHCKTREVVIVTVISDSTVTKLSFLNLVILLCDMVIVIVILNFLLCNIVIVTVVSVYDSHCR